jgi:hypothetical protein
MAKDLSVAFNAISALGGFGEEDIPKLLRRITKLRKSKSGHKLKADWHDQSSQVTRVAKQTINQIKGPK